MKKIIASVLAASVVASSAMADGYAQDYNVGVVTHIDAIYVEVPARYHETRCQDIYTDRITSSGDVLTGMILGGIAGKVIGGNDRGAAAGAIIGGVIAGDTSPRHIETRCQEFFVDEVRQEFSHYRIEYVINGRYYIYDTPEYYEPGSRIYVTPTK